MCNLLVQIAVVKETGGKGPYCSLILAVVVMKDVLVFICFALNLEFARMVRHLLHMPGCQSDTGLGVHLPLPIKAAFTAGMP